MTVAEVERIGSPDITRADARQAFLDYRRALLKASDPHQRREYEGLMRGYKAIASGRQVIDLHRVIQVAGLQPDTLYPRLAIAQADMKWCRLSYANDGSAKYVSLTSKPDWNTRWPTAATRSIKVPGGSLPVIEWRAERDAKFPRHARFYDGQLRWNWSSTADAIVPLVPAGLHPGPALSNYHILWDAVWEPAPPKDPLLLKHLAGALYAVVAHWDLTPLEQAVLRGRLS